MGIGERNNMRSIKTLSKIFSLMALTLALGLSGCAAVEAERQAQAEKQQETVHRMDVAHIWVTTEAPPAGKPYTTLGDLTYTEPFTPDAIEEDKITARLKKMAMDKWPDDIDAIVNENTAVSPDATSFTVSAKAIKYDSSVDREALHHMNEGMVASPSNNQ
jgi:hypothetical protein